jgi:hypothetical protein
MRRANSISAHLFSVALIVLLTHTADAQQAAAAKPKVSAAARAEAAATPSQLPVTRVSLYKNGVGFFEHAGRVTGDQSVTIDFTSAQLDDVLQSLTAIDLNGGRIAGAGYNSTTPLDQQLKALPLALPNNTTFSILFNALKGTRVEVTGSGAPFTGRLVDEEMHKTGAGKDEAGMTEGRFLTVAADSGEVRIFQLTPLLTVRLLDTAAHTDLTQYLQGLDSNRNSGLRHLTIEDTGTGGRELHVSYISEVPIWKSTYRILFSEPKAASGTDGTTQTATMQGWSVIDNTTGADWVNVQLSLIAGAPQSFIQPLSVPYYSRRPEIGLPQEAQLTPQTHESGEVTTAAKAAAPAAAASVAGMGMATGNGPGIGAGSGGNFGGSIRANAAPQPAMALRGVLAGQAENNAAAEVLSADAISQYQASSISPNTTTAAFDDYFAYNIAEPITIRKNESALVPILQTKIDAERVTLWSRQQGAPLRALWITNKSKLTLDRGSFSIVEDGNFGGEGLLDPIHPDEKRLLSYAVDQAVRVTTDAQRNSSRVTSFSASKGVVVVRSTQTAEVTYVVRNAAAEQRTVVVEHPVRQGYTLESTGRDGSPAAKPAETTPAVYRFRVVAKPNETVRLRVGETQPGAVNYQLTSTNDNQLTLIMNQTNHNPALEAALQAVLAARRHVADMQEAWDKVNTQLAALHSDEERQRANVTALANADKASRERFVHDLNATEDQIAAAQKDLTAAQAKLQAAKDDLANKIESIQLDEKL